MNLIKFLQEFPDENSCKIHFKNQREKHTMRCKSCDCINHFWLENKWQWQCKSCGFRTTLKSGTIMENSKVTFQIWYLTVAFMTFSKKTISASELQRQLAHPKYDTIWRLMHKIRTSMGQRDDLYKLEGMIEFDEGYFEKAIPEKVELKRGRGSQRQIKVAVMAESTPLEDINTHTTTSHCRYFKMKVLENHKAELVDKLIQENFDERSIVFTDKSTSYVNISDYVEVHITEKSTAETTRTTLKWVHIAISNAKRTLLGIFHKIKGKYLQSYLNEFCYKLNRRYFGENLFYRATFALATNL